MTVIIGWFVTRLCARVAKGVMIQHRGKVNRNGIVRLNQGGGIDETFNPGGGADNPIQDVIIQDDGKIIIAGDFTSFNGVAINRIARINNDGRIDETFNVGSAANFGIHDVCLTMDGGIVLVGDFNTFNGSACMGIVVLQQSGETIVALGKVVDGQGVAYSGKL